MWSYLGNQRLKQTKLVDLQFLSTYALFSKKLCRKLSKKRSWNIIPLNDRLNGHPENFKINLYYFQERLSLRYNIILKVNASVSYMLVYMYVYSMYIYVG